MNRIKEIVDKMERNPHWLSKKANITYRIVLDLYKKEEIPPTTTIGTLWSIAQVLGVGIDDLYIPRKTEIT